MRIFILSLLFITLTFGMKVTYHEWEKGKTFSDYLDDRNISKVLLQSISPEDKKFLLEIRTNYKYYELINENGILEQALIPISEEMQIHLFKKHDESYGFDIIPVVYRNQEYFAKVEITSNPYSDALKVTNYPNVAKRLAMALDGVIDTRKLHKGDEVAFIYTQKTRLGELYSMPKIKMAKVDMGKKEQFIYVDEEGYGYKEVKKRVAYTVTRKKKVVYIRRVKARKGSRFGMPLRHIRITSSFAYKRWHPILKRYRPHHGTDFGARRGTPILAANKGKGKAPVLLSVQDNICKFTKGTITSMAGCYIIGSKLILNGTIPSESRKAHCFKNF